MMYIHRIKETLPEEITIRENSPSLILEIFIHLGTTIHLVERFTRQECAYVLCTMYANS